MDKLSVRVREQVLFLQDVNRLLTWCYENGYGVTAGEFLRTPLQQAEYVKTGRSKTLKSNHLEKRACDLHFFRLSDGKYLATKEEIAPIGAFWESLDSRNRWGGNFKSLCDAHTLKGTSNYDCFILSYYRCDAWI